MTTVDALLGRLVEDFADHVDRDPSARRLLVTEMNVDVPVEARFGEGGALLLSLPRGVMATGFEPALGRLRVHCAELEA